jgi:hypothetical protein
MSVELTIERQTYRFDADAVSIGRGTENHVSLPNDVRLKDRHVVLRKVSGRWIVESGVGGTVCIGNGRPVSFGWLNSGEVVHLTEAGPDLLFILTQASPPTTGTPVAEPPGSIVARTMSVTSPRIPMIRNANTSSASLSPKADAPDQPVNLAAGIQQPMTILIIGLILIAGFGITLWIVPGSTQKIQQSAPDSPAPIAQSLRPRDDASHAIIDPTEFLVLIAIGDLSSDNRPHVLGVGWLWDPQTVVISRTLGKTLFELASKSVEKGTPRQPCVIQGIPLEIEQLKAPTGCPSVCVLRLKDAAQLSMPARAIFRHVTAADVERMRHQGKSLKYISYATFQRSPKMIGNHGFSLQPYDPEIIHLKAEDARLVYEQRSHMLKGNDSGVRLERGGLLVDPDQKIVGMTLLDSTVVWTDCLEQSLNNL